MTFVPGRHGHHVPGAVAQGLWRAAGCVCVRREEMQRVLLRSRLKGTERRPSCVTNSPVQVHTHITHHVTFCSSQLSILTLESQITESRVCTVQQKHFSFGFNLKVLIVLGLSDEIK